MSECSVKNYEKEANYRVFLYDVYFTGGVFLKQDHTCPNICDTHLIENEKQAKGERKPRGITHYPFTNKHGAQGFTVYLPLESV